MRTGNYYVISYATYLFIYSENKLNYFDTYATSPYCDERDYTNQLF